MKKTTSKKISAQSNRKPASTAKKSSVSAKSKNAKPGLTSRSAKSGNRTIGAVASKVDVRKPAPTPRAQLAQKGISQNGKAPAQDNHKLKKLSEKVEALPAKPPVPPPLPVEPKVKTYLSAKELKEFKALLLAKRAELAGDVENLTSQALNRKTNGGNEPSFMPIHMADLGSDTWEQDFTLGLIANEQALVREIDQALARIEDKTYGMCIATDQPISKQRLLAKPWAKYCIEYARLREEGRAP